MAQISIRRSTPADLDQIIAIVKQAKALLKADGSPQWQDGHPSRQTFVDDIADGTNWVLTVGKQIAGTATLKTTPDPTYQHIDGSWVKPDEPYGTIHRVAISADFRGQHLSNYFISNLLTVGRLKGLTNFRIDTHPLNKRVQAIAKHFDFDYRGIIKVEDQIDPRRFAYELNFRH